MTFFDKFFASSKNKLFRGKNDRLPACAPRPPTDLEPDRVRVVVFRECERRGRKLLLDSDAVEKIAVEAAGQTPDIVEVNATHAYKYKKPGKDVASMGEMIFGSVGLSTKVRVSYKTHIIPAPLRTILYTTVVPCITRCNPHQSRTRQFSGTQPESNPQRTHGGCASDSAMYRVKSGLHRSSGYASLRALAPGASCCDSDSRDSLRVPSSCDSRLSASSGAIQLCESPFRRPSDAPSISSCSSLGDFKASNLSRNCSAGSLTSLRRRWHQSLAVSLDGSSCDESESVGGRVRTKLGICLVLNLSGPLQTEIEKYLLGNSEAVDAILSRLQNDVEEAYTRLNAFVALTLTAKQAATDSVLQLVAGRIPATPRWMNPHRVGRGGCCESSNGVGQDGLPRWLLPPAACPANSSSAQNFVSAFYEILQQYDTKNTNFFVSTLLTAMLTHNLGWAVEIAKRKSSEEVDYYGANLSKIVITDSEVRPTLKTLIDVLSFFLRNSCLLEHTIHADYVTVTTNPSAPQPKKTADLPQELAAINDCKVPPEKKVCERVTLDDLKGMQKMAGRNGFDEGYGREAVGEASKRWRAVAKLVMAAKNEETKKPLFPDPRSCTSMGVDQVDGGPVPNSGEENFDSGIDCELRDAVACVLSKPITVETSKQILVSSAPVQVMGARKMAVGCAASVGTDVVAEMGCKNLEPTSTKTDESSEKKNLGGSKGLRKTVTHFNFSEIVDDAQVLTDGADVDECDFVSRNRVDSVYEAMEIEVAKEKVLWTVGDDEALAVDKNIVTNQKTDLSKPPNIFSENCETPITDQSMVVPNPYKTELSKMSFVDQLGLKTSSKDCCNSLLLKCSHRKELKNPAETSRNPSVTEIEISLLSCVEIVPTKKNASKDFEPETTLPIISMENNKRLLKSSPVDNELQKEDFVLLIDQTPSKTCSYETTPNGCYSVPKESPMIPDSTLKVSRLKNTEKDVPMEESEGFEEFLCVRKEGCLYPDLTELARLENVCLDDLTSAPDKTLFVDEVLRKAEMAASPSSDDGYHTMYGEEARKLLGLKSKVLPVYTKSSSIEPESEEPTATPRRRKCPTRSVTVNIPLVTGLTMLRQRSNTMEKMMKECPPPPAPPTLDVLLCGVFQELPMPKASPISCSRLAPCCSPIGGISSMLHPHQMLQGVSGGLQKTEDLLRRDLSAVCRFAPDTVSILADMQSWCVWVHRSDRTSMGSPRSVRASACPLIADMVESLAHLNRIGVSPAKCQEHLERKLEEIYDCSKVVAEFLMLRDELVTVEALTSHLDVNVNDIPLLLSVAAVHTPEIAEFYGVTIS